MTEPGVRLLVVGEPPRIAGAVGALREHGCLVRVGDNPKRVSDYCDETSPDAVVLDVAPGTRAVAVDAMVWVSRSAMVPVLALTEPDDVETRLRAIALHAEVAVMPVDPREVVARVAGMVRRRRAYSATNPLGDLVVDIDGHRALRGGREVVLTPREAKVLELLIERPGRVVSKQEFLDRVWGGSRRNTNSVEAQISAIRRKLHALGPPIIHTAHGLGYVFRPSTSKSDRYRLRLERERDVLQRELLVLDRERLVVEREEAVHRRTKVLGDRRGPIRISRGDTEQRQRASEAE